MNSRSKRRSHWTRELSAALGGLELLTSPPVGRSSRLGRLLRHIRLAVERMDHRSEKDFLKALDELAHGTPAPQDSSKEELRGLGELSLEQVVEWASDASKTKADLLALIRERFGASTGSLARLPKSAIVEQLNTLIMNERGHASISRVASQDSDYYNKGRGG